MATPLRRARHQSIQRPNRVANPAEPLPFATRGPLRHPTRPGYRWRHDPLPAASAHPSRETTNLHRAIDARGHGHAQPPKPASGRAPRARARSAPYDCGSATTTMTGPPSTQCAIPFTAPPFLWKRLSKLPLTALDQVDWRALRQGTAVQLSRWRESFRTRSCSPKGNGVGIAADPAPFTRLPPPPQTTTRLAGRTRVDWRRVSSDRCRTHCDARSGDSSKPRRFLLRTGRELPPASPVRDPPRVAHAPLHSPHQL